MTRPTVLRYPSAIDALEPTPYLGWDWEWSIRTGTPTILGVSDGKTTVSVSHDAGFPRLLSLLERYPQTVLVGHNVLQADLQVAASLGWHINPKQVEDTIIRHWLLNLHLCKNSKKADDGEGERRGRGWMNLWAFCSLYTDAPNWKSCTDEELCLEEKRPCPEHDVWGYNGSDAYWPVVALPKALQLSKLRGVDKLYPLHREVSLVLAKMTQDGLRVDVPYVDDLRQEFLQRKQEYWNKETGRGLLPFNPDSPKQIQVYFKSKGIELEDTFEETIAAAAETYDLPELDMLVEQKELGDGPDRWFAPREWSYKHNEWEGYVDDSGYIHPSFAFFTSSARLVSSNPNCQNISVRRAEVGSKIRRCVIAPEGYWLYESDLSNAENRIFLHLAGYEIPNIDLHKWVRDTIGLTDDMPFAQKFAKEGKSASREASKSLTHGADYGEGLSLISREDLRKPSMLREIAVGARVVFRDWTFLDGNREYIVSFTGANLAERAFGNRSYESRKLALEAQEKYFARFPKIRDLQRRITKQIEKERCVRPPNGYCTLCLSSETKVLMEDLKWKRLGDLKIGDSIVGFDEYCEGRKTRKLKPAIITKHQVDRMPCFEIETTKGKVVATAQHLWLCSRNGSAHKGRINWHRENNKWLGTMWARTEVIRPGMKMCFFCDPWEEDNTYEAGYLAAFFDSEGHLVDKAYVAADQKDNHAYRYMIDLLKQKGFTYTTYERGGKRGKVWTTLINGREQPSLRFVGSFRPKRLLQMSNRLWEGKAYFGRAVSLADVISITPLGEREIVRVETSTKTLIADGFMSHNSYGFPADRIKTALAIWGSQPIAHITKLAMLNVAQDPWLSLRAQIHDALLMYVPKEHDPKDVKRRIEAAMVIENPDIPGLRIPIEVSYGASWADQRKIE